MKFTKDKLLKIISEGENQEVEFKEKISKDINIAQEIVAFSNTNDGLLIIGVNDEGEITGVKDSKETEHRIVNICNNNCNPSINPKIKKMNIGGKDLFLVSISRIKHIVMTNTKSVYIRKGSHSMKADPTELTNLVMSLNLIDTQIIKKEKEYEILNCCFCDGTGRQKMGSYFLNYPCKVCKGKGKNKISTSSITCSFCDGTGRQKMGSYFLNYPCKVCKGKGFNDI